MPPATTAAMCAHGRVLAEPRLSPDGDRVAFVATASGEAALVVVPVGGGPEERLTTRPAPRPAAAYGGGAFDWSPDGRSLVVAATDGALWIVPASGGRARQLPATTAASSPAVSPDGTRVAYVAEGRHVAVTLLDGTGWPVRLSVQPDFAFDPAWSPDASSVTWHEWDVPDMPWDGGRLVRRAADGQGPLEVVAGGPGVQVQQPRPGPDGTLAHLSDRSGWLNLWLGDRHLVDEPFEHGDPPWGPGQRSFAWSPDGAQLAFTRNEGGFGRLCVVDVAGGEVRDVAKAVHGGLSWVGDHLVALRSGGVTPTQVVAYDTATWARRTLARGPVAGFEASLVEPEVVSWTGDDGGTVHGLLHRPRVAAEGAEPGDLPPLLCWVHGGPTGQSVVTFSARIAYFVDRGWAVLQPNHRGSTGHGRAYTQAMRGRWGELDVADVAAGLRHAAEAGWGHPRRMATMGGSAGGFTVLMVLALHPDLCAAGVDLFGVADLLDLAETTHRFEAHYLDSVVGPLPVAAEVYRERSPVHRAGTITAPLLILQGSDDPVVPPAQSTAIAERLRARGGIVEHHVYPGEGHGWNRPEVVTDELERIESFLRRHVLRGRSA